MLWVTVALPIY